MGTTKEAYKKGLCGHAGSGQWVRVATSENMVFLHNYSFIMGYDLSLNELTTVIKFKDMSIFDFQASQTGNVIAWADGGRELGLYVAELEEK